MLIRNLSDLRAALRPYSCLLGLDYGSVVVGLAISDPGLSVASPLGSLARKKIDEDAATLKAMIKDRNIGGVVIGLPKNMDGTEGPSAQAARAFMRNMMQRGALADDLPVLFWDERLSSAAVERFLIQEDITRKRRGEIVDKAAAAYILQGVLDGLKNSSLLNN